VKGVIDDKLVLSANLNITAWLELAISQMVLFHPHERRIFIRLRTRVAASKLFLILLIFPQIMSD
jgi:hypothetical protein